MCINKLCFSCFSKALEYNSLQKCKLENHISRDKTAGEEGEQSKAENYRSKQWQQKSASMET